MMSVVNFVPFESPKMAANNMREVNCAEPWLYTPSKELYANVLGFISFLEQRLEKCVNSGTATKTCITCEEKIEIQQKLSQLIAWKESADYFFNSNDNNKVNRAFYGRDLRKELLKSRVNFIDEVELPGLIPEITTATVSNHVVNVLTVQQKFAIRRSSSNDSLASTSTSSSSISAASSVAFIAEGDGIRNLSKEVSTESELDAFNVLSTSNVRKGYIFEKCLRSVDTTTESREVFTAIKCSLDSNNKIVDISDTNDRVIVKRVGKVALKTPSSTKNTAFAMNEALKREFKAQFLLTKLQHANINPLIAFFEDEDNMYSVSASAGDKDLMDLLSSYVSKYKKGFNERVVKKWLHEAAIGLLVAHNVGIAHRDVSLENMCVSFSSKKTGNFEDSVLQIIDWGHCTSHKFNLNSNSFVSTKYEGAIGKVRYMSPELMFGSVYGLQTYDAAKSDVWAFGVCLFSMLVGQMPYEKLGDKRSEVLKKYNVEKLIGLVNVEGLELSDEAYDLLNGCMVWEENRRFSMEQVVNHPFFNSIK